MAISHVGDDTGRELTVDTVQGGEEEARAPSDTAVRAGIAGMGPDQRCWTYGWQF